jgi:hypothetical protein
MPLEDYMTTLHMVHKDFSTNFFSLVHQFEIEKPFFGLLGV